MTAAPEIHRMLGRGRHASVWSATLDGDDVAWKRWDDPTNAGRRREVEVRADVDHPRLVPMVAETPDGIVLPLGQASLAMVAMDRPLPVDDLLVLAQHVGEALHAIHEAGWIHGDVAPTNVLRTPDGWALTDLDQAGTAADPPVACGTPGYAAPEVVAGGPASVAGDVHAFAATVVAAGHGLSSLPPGPRAWIAEALATAPEDRPTITTLLDTLPGAATLHAPTSPRRDVTMLSATTDFLPTPPAAPPPTTTDPTGWVALLGLAVTVVAAGDGLGVALVLQAPPAVVALLRAWRSDHRGAVGGVAGRVRGVVDRLRRHLEEALDVGDVVERRVHDVGQPAAWRSAGRSPASSPSVGRSRTARSASLP